MNDFDRDTRTRRSAEHTWAGHVEPAWGNANPNGGYLLSIVVDALRQASPHPDPLSITAHYLRPGLADRPCEVDVRVLRSGRQTSTEHRPRDPGAGRRGATRGDRRARRAR